MKRKAMFRKLANRISTWAGSASVFLGAVLVVLIWASLGPIFDFSDTWQLVINTSTTIVTFLMVFLIQNTQNRDSKAVQLKLDELIHATKSARDSFVGLEDLTDEELAELDGEFKLLIEKRETAEVLAKLHNKIAQEHSRRKAAHQPPTMLTTLLKPLTVPAETAIKAVNRLGQHADSNTPAEDTAAHPRAHN